MIDNFAIGLTHGLMLLAAWRLLARPDLEDDSVHAPPPPEPRRVFGGWGKERDGA